jgi:hypothetical protein
LIVLGSVEKSVLSALPNSLGERPYRRIAPTQLSTVGVASRKRIALHRFFAASFSGEIEVDEVDGSPFRVYGPEKTRQQ